MWQRIVTSMLTCLVMAVASPASAQLDTARSARSLAITSTFAQSARIDETASPVTFGGGGFGVGVAYRAAGTRWAFAATLDGARHHYVPRDVGDAAARERATGARLDLRLLRQVIDRPTRSVGVGLTADAWGEVLEHRYADPGATISDYVTAFSTLGAGFAWRESVGGGAVSFDASVPFAGLVHQPYGDSRPERASPAARPIGPRELHAVELAARYESSFHRRTGIVAEYHFRAFDFASLGHMRSVANSTSLGIVTRFGRAPR